MSTIQDEIDAKLREYAELLKEHGYNVYAPKKDRLLTYFIYSRTVEGTTYWGDVQSDRPLGGFTHHMPIKPSREHGSSMWVDGTDNVSELTVEQADTITSPRNRNSVVGEHVNYGGDEKYKLRGYEQL